MVFSYTKRLNLKWGRTLAKLDVWPLDMVQLNPEGDLLLPRVDTPIKEANQGSLILINRHRMAGDLCQRAGAKFEIHQNHILIDVSGVRGVIRNIADIQVFHEVFVERFYSFEYPGPFFVLDLGANIGLASLYFAAEYDAECDAYELVPSTAVIATENLDLNPKLEKMIQLHTGGVSDQDGEFELEVASEARTSNSLFEAPNCKSRTVEKVKVKDVGPAFQIAYYKAKGRTFVLKIDIEGAEYEVLSRLHELGLLQLVDVLFLEWHSRSEKDPEYLRNILRTEGFIWNERQHPEAPVGLINAFRVSAEAKKNEECEEVGTSL